jgi:predicted protein tyrosine phosphatase
MKILILSHQQFENLMSNNKLNDKNVEETTQAAFISIVDTEGIHYKHWFEENHKNVLNLKFDDIDTKEIQVGKWTANGFSVEQGKEVLTFLENINKDSLKVLVIHCAAGVSRSAGIGDFANDYFQLDNNVFLKDNPHIHPNMRVKRILNRLIRGIEMDE